MLWSKVLVAFDSSPEAWRAVEYAGQIYGRLEDVKIRLVWVYDKVPEHDMVETPFTDQVKGRISAMERERAEGIQKLEEAVKQLIRAGLPEDMVKSKAIEKKKGVAKDLVAEAMAGDFGTVILGGTARGVVSGALLGSVCSGVVAHIKDAAVVLVQ